MKNLRTLTIVALSLITAIFLMALPATAQTPDDQPVPVDPAFTEDLKGYLVTVTVRDQSGNPQASVNVTLDETTVQTDPTGIASYQDIAAGDHQLTVDGNTKTVTVISTSNKAAIQDFPVTIGEEGDSTINSTTGRTLLIVLLVILAGVVLLAKPLKKRKAKKVKHAESKTTNGLTDEQREKLLKPNPPKAETVIHPEDKDK